MLYSIKNGDENKSSRLLYANLAVPCSRQHTTKRNNKTVNIWIIFDEDARTSAVSTFCSAFCFHLAADRNGGKEIARPWISPWGCGCYRK